jgi:phosphoglycolate phosphatase
MPIKLIIFDLDGTLVDTGRDITNALNDAIGPYGRGPLTVQETIAMVGEGLPRLIEKALGEENRDKKEEALSRFLEYHRAHLIDYTRPYPRVKQTLEMLGGLKKAVLSNKLESLTVRLLEKLGLAGYFDLVAGSDTPPEQKPSARAVQYVLDALGVHPAQALMVGDSPTDIEAGRAAGVATVAVTYGYRDRSLLAEADYVIDSLEELVPVLNMHYPISERRRELRYPASDYYGKYVGVKLETAEGLKEAALLDFSEHGMKLRTDQPLKEGEVFRCLLSIPESPSSEVSLSVVVKHAAREGEDFVVGAEVSQAEDEAWFAVFKRSVRLMMERHGEVL